MEEAQEITVLLNSLVGEHWGLPPGAPTCPFKPWGATGGLGIHIGGESEWFTPEIEEWFRRRGWLAVSFEKVVRRLLANDPPAPA